MKYEKCKVISLPTDKAIETWNNQLVKGFTDEWATLSTPTEGGLKPWAKLIEKFVKPYQLYILSNDKLQVNDVVMSIGDYNKHLLFTIDEDFLKTGLTAYKVIASTDREIGVAAISSKFVDEYCHKNGAIEFVQVEYVEDWRCSADCIDKCIEAESTMVEDICDDGCVYGKEVVMPIENAQHEITVHPFKGSFETNEVIILIQRALCEVPSTCEYEGSKLNTWLKDNLKEI